MRAAAMPKSNLSVAVGPWARRLRRLATFSSAGCLCGLLVARSAHRFQLGPSFVHEICTSARRPLLRLQPALQAICRPDCSRHHFVIAGAAQSSVERGSGPKWTRLHRSVTRSASEKDASAPAKTDTTQFILLLALGLILIGPATFAATWTVWWIAAGALSIAGFLYFAFVAPLLIAISIAGALSLIALSGVQLMGFSVVASSLALLSLLFKTSVLIGGVLAIYTLAKGEPPKLFGFMDNKDISSTNVEEVSTQDKSSADVEKVSADRTNTDSKSTPFADWDDQFFEKQRGVQDDEKIRFEDLSPSSPLKKLRAFVVQERLVTKTKGVKAKDLYREIAIELLKR